MKRLLPRPGRKMRTACAAVLLLCVLAAAGQPFGASSVWSRIFSLFGLGGFSSCADGWPVSVHVLDVGKADSILIECEGRDMLVDGGTPDRGESVVRYLKRRGISNLEYVVNTHPDEDHVGGLKYVLQRFSVKRFFAPKIRPELVPKDAAYLDTMEALRRKGLSAEAPKPGNRWMLGDLSVTVLGPVVPGSSTNNSSLILMLRYRSIRFLLTGDAENEEEQSLLNAGEHLSANVLKVGHHGSSTSTSPEFLNAVRPDYAVISVGSDRNRLPKLDVLQRLKSAGAKIYRTDLNGTVIFLTDGKSITVKTQK